MKKRLIDIFPPQINKAVLENEEIAVDASKKTFWNREQKASKTTRIALLLIVLFVVPALSSHLFFARATIQVWPRMTKLHIEERITAQVGQDKLNLEKKIIRARLFEEEKELTQLFSSSGKKFKEEKARGTIRVYNENSTQPQTLVANTRFISEDGKLFRLQTPASIPGGRLDGRKLVPGFLDVQVVAAAPGEEFNIGPSHFSLPGLAGSPAYTKVYGESLQPMTGGEQREVMVVTEEDIASAKDQLEEILKTEAVKALLSRVPPQFQMLQDSLVSFALKDNSLVKPGAELSQFNYTATMRVAMSGFHTEDADVLVKHLLSNYLAENQVMVNEKTLQVASNVLEDVEIGSAIPIRVQITADQYQKIDTTAFVKRAGGVSDVQLRQVMGEYPFLAKAQFSLWPFWISSIPKDPQRVNLEVVLEG